MKVEALGKLLEGIATACLQTLYVVPHHPVSAEDVVLCWGMPIRRVSCGVSERCAISNDPILGANLVDARAKCV
jgi:hypothetical protein